METRKGINSTIVANEREIKDLSSKRDWDARSTDQNTKKHLDISSILMLPLDREEWPVVEMEI